MTGGHPEREATRCQVRRIVDRLVRYGTAVARSDSSVHSVFPVAVSGAEGEALRRWIIHEGAVRTIEVGFGYGISALFTCEGLLFNAEPGARHIVIDPNQATRFANLGLQLLDEAGVTDLVEHLAEESQIVLPRLLARKPPLRSRLRRWQSPLRRRVSRPRLPRPAPTPREESCYLTITTCRLSPVRPPFL